MRAHAVTLRARLGALLAAGTLLLSPSAMAAEPCGGLTLTSGVVETGDAIPLGGTRTDTADACFKAIATAVLARPEIRSITVAARAAGDANAHASALGVANYVADRLVAMGVPRLRVSAVAPNARPDESPHIRFAYVARRSQRPVAQVYTVGGKVWAGHTLGELRLVTEGTLLTTSQYIETGTNSVAIIVLADQSRMRIQASSVIRLGDITFDAVKGRNVKVELLRGGARLRASKSRGPLRLITGNAVAGVRGTDFRMAVDETEVTRLEATEGTVNLAGNRGNVFVTNAEGSRIDFSGRPERPRPLLISPTIITPVLGNQQRGDVMEWSKVPQAKLYRIDIAQDAQFTKRFRIRESANTKLLVSDTLAPGKWFWRVTAVDVDGFVGLSSKIYAFVLP
ncbi:MAG: ferric-dicitrate binding protein FerR (iron transport regulator) [Myxococcota bacterium]|jgi:ferric-dicitrate binding protein FerR (iron transport regulator)